MSYSFDIQNVTNSQRDEEIARLKAETNKYALPADPTEPTRRPNNLRKSCAKLLLVSSLVSSSALGVIQSNISAEGAFLKNAWRFQALVFIMIFLSPFYVLYQRYYLKYERYRSYIRALRKRGIVLDRTIRASVQMND